MALRNRGVDAAIHEAMEEARTAAFPDPGAVVVYRNYARGRQRNTLTRECKRVLRNAITGLFCENVCKRVLTVLTNRIKVLGFQVNNKGVEAFLNDVWVRLWLPLFFSEVIWTAWRDGNCGATMGWDNKKVRPKICREKWWDGKAGIWFCYDETGEPEYAVKEWKPKNGDRHRTFYYPGKICRYIEGKDGWRFRDWTDAAGRTQNGPQPWTSDNTPTGTPLGIAAEHFARRVEPPDGSDDVKDNQRDSIYGVSLYDGGIIGLQDAVNDQHRNLLAAARFTAFQIPWASGVELGVDKDTGEPNKLEVEPGAGLTSPDPTARFGAIPAGSIEQLLKQLANLLRAISQTAAVPEHLIAGQWPSGAALMRAEMPLIDQAQKGATVLGPAFASVMHKCVVMSNAFAGTTYDTQAAIITLFEDPQKYDPMTLTDLAVARADYIPLDEVWRLMGYDAKTRLRFATEMQKEAAWRQPAQPGGAEGVSVSDTLPAGTAEIGGANGG